MRRALVVASVLAMALVVARAGWSVPQSLARTGPLRLVSTPWSPFTNVDPPRFANDLVHEALERNGILEQTTIMEEGRLSPALEAAEYDGSAALWRAPERERYLLYSEPYLENRLMLVGRKGADLGVSSLSGLAGRKVALVAGLAYGDAVAGAKGPEFVVGRSHELNLRRLLAGEVDYMLVDALVIRHLLEQHADEARAKLEVGRSPLLQRTLHFAVRRDLPDAEAIVARFNAEIRRMLADGSYNRILELSWIRADVDGDGQPELVLRGDHAGQLPPESGYQVFAAEAARTEKPPSGTRFVIGGETYPDWSQVPQRYKTWDPSQRDAERSRATLFRFEF